MAAIVDGVTGSLVDGRSYLDPVFRHELERYDKDAAELGQIISMAVATHRVGKRPWRYEPRERKKQQRKYKELKKSRRQRRRELEQEQGQEQHKGVKGGGKDRPSGRQR